MWAGLLRSSHRTQCAPMQCGIRLWRGPVSESETRTSGEAPPEAVEAGKTSGGVEAGRLGSRNANAASWEGLHGWAFEGGRQGGLGMAYSIGVSGGSLFTAWRATLLT